MVLALSLHLILSAFAGVVQADPTGPLRTVADADAVLCTGTGMRYIPGTAEGGAGGALSSATALCALCVPALPDALPDLPDLSPAALAFVRQALSQAHPAPDLSPHHRPQPRGPPVLS